MLLYAIIMFLVAALFLVFGILIYKGNTNLIHDYHQTKVKDHAAYGKAFGKSMFVIAAALCASGVLGLLGDGITMVIALCVLIVGILIGIGCIIAVQKKYNNGVF